MTRASTRTLIAIAAIVAMALPASAAATTVVVTGDNQAGWLFNRDARNVTPYAFEAGPAVMGVGSLHVAPITNTVNGNADKFIGELYLAAPVADFASISYDFQIDAASPATSEEQFYLNIYAALPGEGFYNCRFDVVPTTGSTGSFTTVSYAATDAADNVRARNVASCPASLAGMPAGSVVNFISLNVGDTTASDDGVGGYFDNVVTTIAGNTTTYDFEPATTPTTKQECMKGGWQTFNTPTFRNQGQCVSFVNHNS